MTSSKITKYDTYKQSLFTKLDIFGISYNFLINGENKYKTQTGAFLTLFYGFIFVGLFFGFGYDLYQRKRPKVSLNSQVIDYSKVKLSNENFTYAYRVEDRLAVMQLDESIIYQEINYLYFEIQEGAWVPIFQQTLPNKRCHELPNAAEKEAYYNISLEHWNCVDFDNMTLGGNWDGNFVYFLLLNTKQCINGTNANNLTCSTSDQIQTKMGDVLTGGNLFYSDLSLQILPAMDDFENPLKTTLINRYELLNLNLTKRKIQNYQYTSISNDIGWFFTYILEETFLSSDIIMNDFTFKDQLTQDILFTQFVYIGRKFDTYNRSYTKVQEVFAAIGGFAKFFYFVLNLLFYYGCEAYKNLILISNIPFDEKEVEKKTSTKTNFMDNNSYWEENIKNRIDNMKLKVERRKPELPPHVSYKEYILHKFCFTKTKNYKTNKILDNYKFFNYYFSNALNIFTFLDFYNQFNQLKKIVFDKTERKALLALIPKVIDFNVSKKEEGKKSEFVEINQKTLSIIGIDKTKRQIKPSKLGLNNFSNLRTGNNIMFPSHNEAITKFAEEFKLNNQINLLK